jgi:hypothetical protein
MRGKVDPQSALFSYFSPESRVPVGHSLRAIKTDTNAELGLLYSSGLPTLDSAGTSSEGPAADRAVLGALGPPVLSDARLQHSVPLVPGHEPG